MYLWFGKQLQETPELVRVQQDPNVCISLSSPARLTVKAVSFTLGEMESSCVNLFKKYSEYVIITLQDASPPDTIKPGPPIQLLISNPSVILKAHPGLSRTEEGITTRALVLSDTLSLGNLVQVI